MTTAGSQWLPWLRGWLSCVTLMMSVYSDSAVYHQLEYDFNEEQPAAAIVGNVRTDARLGLGVLDADILSRVRFTQRQRNPFFVVDETSGDISSTRRIDRELLCPYVNSCEQVLEVTVTPLTLFQLVRVIINIVDVNDHDPVFPTDWLTLDIIETAKIGSTFSLPEAEDADSQPLSVSGYRLQDGSSTFELETSSRGDGSHEVRVRLTRTVDRETREYYSLMLFAVDGGQPQRSASMHIDVFIRDANDNSPTFDSTVYTARVYEDVPIGTSVLRVSAYDPDDGDNAVVTYRCAVDDLSTSTDTFAINETTGEIFVNGSIDFETRRVHELTVVAEDRGPSPLPAFARVIIYVQDVNDMAPLIMVNTLTQDGLHAAVLENAPPGTFVSHVAVSDADSGRNAEVACSVDSPLFFLDAIFDAEFKLVTKVVLDREKQAQHEVEISCRDAGVQPLTSTRRITVRVMDENDNTPQLEREVFTVDIHENNHVGDVILVVNAGDFDDGRNAALTYRLEPLDSPQTFSDVVSIDHHGGVIKALTTFDFESRQTYSFLMTVSDGGIVAHSRVATVVLNVLDDNDEIPTFIRSSYAFHVPENRSPSSGAVGRIRATDADLSAQHRAVFYSLEGHDSRAFRVSAQTGELFSRVSLDREVQPVWRFRARASNDPLFNPRSPLSVVDVIIYVSDVNDNFPIVRRPQRINETFVVRELLPAGHVVTRVEATDADDGQNARLTYTIINGGAGDVRGERSLFIIDDANGDVTTSRDIQRDDMGMYTLLIAISDAGQPRRLTTTQIIVVVNVTVQQRGSVHLGPPVATIEEDTEDYTVALIVGICCAAVLLKLVIVGVLCVRHNVALRGHTSGSGTIAHKISVGHQKDVEANDSATKSSVWKRLHGDHRNDVIPSSCSVNSDNGLLVRHWYHTDTSPASQSPAANSTHQISAAVNHLYRVRPQTDHTGHCPRPMFTNNGHVIHRNDLVSGDGGYATAVRSLSYNAVTSLRNPGGATSDLTTTLQHCNRH